MSSKLQSGESYRVQGHLVKATEVTAGLAESRPNGSLPLVDGLVTCGLTAYTPGSAPGPTLNGKILTFYTCEHTDN